MKLIAYMRTSRLGGRDEADNLSRSVQQEKIAAYAALHGHEIAEWIYEADKSGRDGGREKWNAVLDRVTTNGVDGIIVMKLNRFARNAGDALKATARLRAAEKQLVSVEEQLDTSTPMGKAMLGIMMVLAELDSDIIGQVWADNTKAAVARGIHCARIPTGYSRGDDRTLVPGEHADTVTRLFTKRAAGASLSELARWFTEQGAPTRTGKPWSAEGVRQLLANRVYLGEARGGQAVKVDAHPALTDEATYAICQTMVGERAPIRNGELTAPLLGGLIRCEHCGGRMSYTSTTVGGKKHFYYACKGNSGCTQRASIGASMVEPLVTAWALEYLGGVQYTAPGAKSQKQLDDAVRKAEANFVAYEQTHEPSDPGYAETLIKYRDALKAARQAAAVGASGDVERLWIEPEQVKADFAGMNSTDQRAILAHLLDCVRVTRGRGKGRVRVEYKGLPADVTADPVDLAEAYAAWEARKEVRA